MPQSHMAGGLLRLMSPCSCSAGFDYSPRPAQLPGHRPDKVSVRQNDDGYLARHTGCPAACRRDGYIHDIEDIRFDTIAVGSSQRRRLTGKTAILRG